MARDAAPVRRFLQILFLLLLIAAGVGGRYLYNRGLTKSWREWVVKEVRKQGVEVSFARLTVRPFRGLVAKDVRFYDSPARNRVVAQMNEMVIEANYANAAKGKPFLDALTLVDSSLRLPLDPGQPFGPFVSVEKLNARVLFPPNQVHLTRLDATVLGVRVRASGSLVLPPGFSISPGSGGPAGEQLASLVKELGMLRFEGPQPLLNVTFAGDITRPDEMLITANLTAEKIRRGSYSLAALGVDATFQNGVVLLSRLDAADATGRLQASGSYEPKSRAAELRLRSGLDLAGLLRELEVEAARDFVLHSPPQIELTARHRPGGDARPILQMLGHARLGRFSYGGVPFLGMYADFSWDGRRWAVRDLSVKQSGGGELKGDMQQDYDETGKGDFRLMLTSSISPEPLAPLLPEKARSRFKLMKFPDAPRISISARGTEPGITTLSASGTVKAGRLSYRGIDARGGEAEMRFANGVLSIDSFEVRRSEGIGTGRVAYDFNAGLWHIHGVKTTLHPAEVVLWIDPEIQDELQPYRFGKRPPVLHLDGTVDPGKGGTRTRLNVIADAPGGMDYTFAKKDLHFGTMKGRIFFTDDRLKLTDLRGDLLGGTLRADGEVSLIRARPGHAATVRLADVDFSKLSKLYFDFDDSKGKLDGVCNFTGRGDDVGTLRADGEVTVSEGNVFAIPFLGPLSGILDKLIPGMGYSRARKATATFAIADGILSNKDLVIAGNGFSMFGGGRIWIMEDKIDFDIRINTHGLPGMLLTPVSKLFEYRANSAFSKPDWKPKVFQAPRQQ